MNLTQIKYFLEVADGLNFTAAAGRLYVSQQCISKQIARLEREIGVRLFDRSTAKVSLTEAGHLLRTEWGEMLARAEDAVVRARAVQDAARPTIRMGLLELVGVLDFVLPRITAYGEAHPEIELEYEIGSFAQIQEWLVAGRVDLIVSFSSELEHLPERYACQDLKELPLYIILAKSHPLAYRDSLSFRDIKGEIIYTFAPEYSVHAVDLVLTHCRRVGFTPEFKFFNSINAMELALHAGKGVNVAFKEFYRNQEGTLKFYPVPVMDGWRQPTIAVSWARGRPHLESFVHYLEAEP